LPFLKKATWGDKSLEFLDRLEDLAEKTIQLPTVEDRPALPSPQTDEDELVEDERFDSALSASPSLGILQAWIPVERELRRIARSRGYSPDRTRSPTYTIRQLVNDATISAKDFELLKEMLALRNIAAHPHDVSNVTREDAREYRTLADITLERLKRL
jgi:hypothetical protein